VLLRGPNKSWLTCVVRFLYVIHLVIQKACCVCKALLVATDCAIVPSLHYEGQFLGQSILHYFTSDVLVRLQSSTCPRTSSPERFFRCFHSSVEKQTRLSSAIQTTKQPKPRQSREYAFPQKGLNYLSRSISKLPDNFLLLENQSGDRTSVGRCDVSLGIETTTPRSCCQRVNVTELRFAKSLGGVGSHPVWPSLAYPFCMTVEPVLASRGVIDMQPTLQPICDWPGGGSSLQPASRTSRTPALSAGLRLPFPGNTPAASFFSLRLSTEQVTVVVRLREGREWRTNVPAPVAQNRNARRWSKD